MNAHAPVVGPDAGDSGFADACGAVTAVVPAIRATAARVRMDCFELGMGCASLGMPGAGSPRTSP
ncbi:hypothetical protein BN11_860015 [Nostocoides australiense Ben110]|uniref:Uncharacterized protein n=1 Tax=Nostocoides australiense Ben110 TaxID=1193182 RepID=W6K353_9MICO|nr:hypothetical protein BN11_860015 [Tetrasphaera australiensis Ben110]